MSEPVECFMLEQISKQSRKLIVLTLIQDPCPTTGKEHRLEFEIPQKVSLDSIVEDAEGLSLRTDDIQIPLACVCGLRFTKANSESTISGSYYEYRNPKTGKINSLPHLVATPGAMWECPWLVEEREEIIREGGSFLSQFFVRDWLGKRYPICVMCPDGSNWIVDQKSSNGDGWTITGEEPKLTAKPSIQTPGYHSWLTDGLFGTDPNCKLYER
jgi:hypothetical protein